MLWKMVLWDLLNWKIEDSGWWDFFALGRKFVSHFLDLLLGNYFQNCSACITNFNLFKTYWWYVITFCKGFGSTVIGEFSLSFSVSKREDLAHHPFRTIWFWFTRIFTFLFFLIFSFSFIRYLNVRFLV